jgi:hypothetical protein
MGVAPTLSVGIVAVAAIISGWIRLDSWNWIPIVGLTAVLCVIAWGFDRAGLALLPRWFKPTSKDNEEPSQWQKTWPSLVALVSAMIIATWQFVQMFDRPDSFSQSYDNMFHMNAVRWILDTGQASSFTVSSVTTLGQTSSFYPAAWHDLVSLAAITINSTIIGHAANSVIWVLMAVIWPLSCLFLVSKLFPQASAPLIISAGILSASFAAFPTLILGFGVVYPNTLGFSLIPVCFGLILSILNIIPGGSSLPLPHRIVILLGCLVGLFLAHPNAVLSLMAMISPVGIVWAYRGIRKARAEKSSKVTLITATYIAATVVTLIAFASMWIFSMIQDGWPPSTTLSESFIEILSASPMAVSPFWVLAFLIISGIIYFVSTASLRWWAGTFTIICVLWVAASAMPRGKIRNLLVSIYYTDPHRVGALLVLALYPTTVMGIQQLLKWASWLAQRLPRINIPPVKVLSYVAAGILLVTGIQLSPAMSSHISWMHWHYWVDPSAAPVDSDEYALIQRLPEFVPPDARIANNPWSGSSFTYALTGILVSSTHVTGNDSKSQTLIRYSLRDAQTNPKVCEAIEALDLDYALEFMTHDVHPEYPGLKDLDQAEGFTLLAENGQAKLFRIDACNS